MDRLSIEVESGKKTDLYSETPWIRGRTVESQETEVVRGLKQ